MAAVDAHCMFHVTKSRRLLLLSQKNPLAGVETFSGGGIDSPHNFSLKQLSYFFQPLRSSPPEWRKPLWRPKWRLALAACASSGAHS